MGLLKEAHTGGLDLSFGNRLSALELVHQMANGEGFGQTVGQGVRKMKKIFVADHGIDPKILEDIGMEAKGLEFSEYMTKESLAQQGGYGLALGLMALVALPVMRGFGRALHRIEAWALDVLPPWLIDLSVSI